MTSSNHNGHDPFSGRHGMPGFDGPGETVKGQPAQGRPTRTNHDGDGLAGQGSGGSLPTAGKMSLPADFNTAHFLDPTFLAGLANELLAEGLPGVGRTDTGAVEEMESVLPDPAHTSRSASAALQAGRRGPINFHDPRLFLGIAEDFLPPMPSGPAEVKGLTGPGMETYYFLPQPVAAELASKPAPQSSRTFQVEAVRKDFPILHQTVHGKPLIWLDNAATTQKPRQVIEALTRFYEHDNSNIHRGAHTLAARATDLYEGARDKVRRFLGAGQVEEIVFVHGATEAINLVAQTYGRKNLDRGDEIVLSEVEHHANLVPWQQLAHEKGAVLRVIPVNDRGEIILEEYERLLGPRTRLVAITHVSNALGTVLPVRTMTELAHRHGAPVLIDGAQSIPHIPINVQELDCDFFAFSGHKLFAPTGIGVLYGKRDLLEAMPPWQGGGNMIDQVTFESTTYQQAPAKFEAGTGILAGAVGLGAAIDYLEELGMENLARYEHELLAYGTELLSRIPGLRLIGTAREKASVLSFVLDGVRTEDMGRFLDQEGIAVRAGHHCAQPTMKRFGVTSTVRPSLAFYNTPAELDALASAIRKAQSMLG